MPEKTMSLFSLILCIVYAIAGTAAFVTFLILKYYFGAVYGFVVGSVSTITAHIIWLHRKDRLNLWYDSEEMTRIFWFAFTVFLLGCGFTTFHIAMMALLMTVYVKLIIPIVWAFIVMKSGLILMYFAHKYKNETIPQADPPLIPQANI